LSFCSSFLPVRASVSVVAFSMLPSKFWSISSVTCIVGGSGSGGDLWIFR
jgi:hypothetical protein